MSIYRYNYKGNYPNPQEFKDFPPFTGTTIRVTTSTLRSLKTFMSIYRYNYKGNYLNPQEFKDFHVHLQVQL